MSAPRLPRTTPRSPVPVPELREPYLALAAADLRRGTSNNARSYTMLLLGRGRVVQAYAAECNAVTWQGTRHFPLYTFDVPVHEHGSRIDIIEIHRSTTLQSLSHRPTCVKESKSGQVKSGQVYSRWHRRSAHSCCGNGDNCLHTGQSWWHPRVHAPNSCLG